MNKDLVLLFQKHVDLCNDLNYQIKILTKQNNHQETKNTRRNNLFRYLYVKEKKEENSNKIQDACESCSTSCGYISVWIWSCVVRPCRCARPIACTRSKPIA